MNGEDRDISALRGELLLLRAVVDRVLGNIALVDEDMMVTAPPVVRDGAPSAERPAGRWRPADPTLDTVAHPARSGLGEAVTALRHVARGAAKHLDHHSNLLKASATAWLGTNEETK